MNLNWRKAKMKKRKCKKLETKECRRREGMKNTKVGLLDVTRK